MHSIGLLKKARSIRESSPALRVLGPDELRVEDDQEITAEERERALAQIELAVARSREAIAPESLAFHPRRRGSLLPLLINIAALVVVAGGVLLAVVLSRRAEKDIAAAPASLLSAEGKVLETLKEESRRELAGKDREIAAIRDKLSGFDTERERIREAADQSVRRREQELADSFARALGEERARLAAGGLSEDAIARKLVDFEAKNRAGMEETLREFREQQRAELERSERTIAALQAEYRQQLSQAQTQRSRLQEESARRQTELEAGYREKSLALEQDKAAALAELARLREQQARERMASDQLLAYYGRAREEIGGARPDAALSALADLRRYLDEPGIATLPAMTRRRPVDLFLADSLEQLIRKQAAEQEASRDLQSLLASANLIAAAASMVEEGDALFAGKDYAGARELYLSALARIPASRAGYERLTEIEGISAEHTRKAVASALSAGNAAYRAGDHDTAVQRYGAALQMLQLERGAVDALVAQLVDIGSLRKAAEIAAAAPPDVVSEAQSLVRQGDVLFAGKDYESARELYLSALARIPASQAGYERLTEIEQIVAARATQAVASVIAAGNDAYRAGDFDAAVERYGSALQMMQVERGAADSFVAQLVDIGSKRAVSEMAAVAASEPPEQVPVDTPVTVPVDPPVAADPDPSAEARARSAAWLEALRARLDSPVAASPPQVTGAGSGLVALLETKLLVQKTLLSPEVVARHPDLYDRLQEYLEALAEESRAEARLEILRDLDSLLVEAAAGEGSPSGRAEALPDRYPAAEQRGLLVRILDSLRGLLR